MKKYSKIAEMTDHNDHGGAIIEGARLLQATKIRDCAEKVKEIHLLVGYMPHELGNYRLTLYKELMNHAKSVLSANDYDQFHQAF